MTTILSPSATDTSALNILQQRDQIYDTTQLSYKLLGGQNFGMDVAFGDDTEIDEGKMTFTFPYASGHRRDGVGDLLEVGGIRTERHQKNPIVLFDHGKQVALPIGVAEDPNTHEYTNFIDPIAKTARLKAFFYNGKGLPGVDKKDEYNHAVFCEQLFDLIRQRYVRGGSIGYQVVKALQLPPDYETGTPQGLHLLVTLMLEGSVVVLPANQDTVAKTLKLPRLCGKRLSPYLVKALSPYAPNKKAQLGFEPQLGQPNQTTPYPTTPCLAIPYRTGPNHVAGQDTSGELGAKDLVPVPLNENLNVSGKIPPARWKPGLGAMKSQIVGDLNWLKEEQQELEHKQKRLGSIRQKYRNGKKAIHRIRKGKPGSSTILVHEKDVDSAKQLSTTQGLELEELPSTGKLRKLKLTGGDVGIEKVAQVFGRSRTGTKALAFYTKGWFQECPRDEQGHCLPKGSASHHKPQKPEAKREEASRRYKESYQTVGLSLLAKQIARLLHAQALISKHRKEHFRIDRQGRRLATVVGNNEVHGATDKRLIRWLLQQGFYRTGGPDSTTYQRASRSTKAMPKAALNIKTKAIPPDDLGETLPEPNKLRMKPDRSKEPYSAQVMRRIHEDFSTLMEDYDDMMAVLEHDPTRDHMMRLLEALEAALTATEDLFGEHHVDLDGLDGAMPLPGVEGEPGTGTESEALIDETDEGAIPADSTPEALPPPEEAVEGMRRRGKGLSLHDRVKALRQNIRSKDAGEMTDPKNLNGKKKSEEPAAKEEKPCPKCGKPGCGCGDGTPGELPPTGKEADELSLQNTDTPEGEAAKPETGKPSDKIFEPHHLIYIGEARDFSRDLSALDELTNEHTKQAYHHHRCLDSIVDHLGKGLGGDIGGNVGRVVGDAAEQYVTSKFGGGAKANTNGTEKGFGEDVSGGVSKLATAPVDLAMAPVNAATNAASGAMGTGSLDANDPSIQQKYHYHKTLSNASKYMKNVSELPPGIGSLTKEHWSEAGTHHGLLNAIHEAHFQADVQVGGEDTPSGDSQEKALRDATINQSLALNELLKKMETLQKVLSVH